MEMTSLSGCEHRRVFQPKMPQPDKDLLHRLLKSPHFRGSPNLRRILQFLSAYPEGGSPKEWEIAVHALGRPTDFDPRRDPIVRVSIASIRERLCQYFQHEGRFEKWRLAIPRGEYRLVFFEQGAEAEFRCRALLDRPALERFWQPYLLELERNLLVFSDLLFFTDGQGTFWRDIFVNRTNGSVRRLRQLFALPKSDQLRPTRAFISAGELRALYSLQALFGEAGSKVEPCEVRELPAEDLGGSNLILIGSSRTNPLVDRVQSYFQWTLTERHVSYAPSAGGRLRRLRDREWAQGDVIRRRSFALLQRTVLPEGEVVTAICANNGRSIQAVAELLTDEEETRRVLQILGNGRSESLLPSHLELLFQVELADDIFREEILATRLLDFRLESSREIGADETRK